MNSELQAIKDAWDASSAVKNAAVERKGTLLCAAWALDNTPNEGQRASIAAAGVDQMKRPGLEKELVKCEDQIALARSQDDDVRALCDAYVTAHPEQFTEYEGMSLEACVAAVGVFRSAGMEEGQWKVEVWLLHHYAPQSIGGIARAIVRIPGQRF